MSRFSTDTVVEPLGSGAYRARIDPGWWIVNGPNGGYVAAVVLRALLAARPDVAHAPRSLTLHYLRPLGTDDATVHVEVERTGRTVTTFSVRVEQAGRLAVVALAAFGTPRPGPELDERTRPRMPRPAECPSSLALGDGDLDADFGPLPEIARRYEYRWRDDPQTAARAAFGGWIRFAEPTPVDDCALAAYCDAWMPPLLARVGPTIAVPTIDLTIHFRAPVTDLRPDAWTFCELHSTVARDGYVEEDGELWSEDGVLLAQSRQLSAILTL